MSEWKEYSLEEITEPIKEAYIPTGNDSLFYIGLEHIEQESLRLNSIGKSTDVTSNKFKFIQDDVLFGKLRPYFRKVVKPNFSGICSTDIWVLRAKKKINQNFLFYFIANWDFVNLSNSGEGGTRMPRADWNYLKQTRWTIPSPKEQTAIASVLSSLDDKIDLLYRQNATLEKMAETLFRQWFVEEAKEEWKDVELGSVVETTSGGTPSRTNIRFYENGTIHWVKSKELNGSFILETEEMITEEALRKSSAKILPVNSILIAMYGATVGEYAIIAKEMTCNQAVCALIPNKNYPYTYLFLLIKHNREELINMAVGSAQQNISQLLIKQLSVLDCIEQIERFNLVVEPLFIKIKSYHSQIRTLKALRDTLLLKLMSGEVKVEM
jgi:type I restriction enzyme S subunit